MKRIATLVFLLPGFFLVTNAQESQSVSSGIVRKSEKNLEVPTQPVPVKEKKELNTQSPELTQGIIITPNKVVDTEKDNGKRETKNVVTKGTIMNSGKKEKESDPK